ncbi:DUF6191 domain-containing protein [Streptomyces sp. NPDC006193]|uniref:DUF6191 domain-containing protein n=1 Tax=Streptomyces sp. NPDC006193 TaxID=3155717 RepID=UPI0033A6AC98
MFNMFEELFAPGRKHTRDEQNRLELTREDVGDNDPGRGPIDLASGKAVIRLSEQEQEQEAEQEAEPESEPEAEPEHDPAPEQEPDPAPAPTEAGPGRSERG